MRDSGHQILRAGLQNGGYLIETSWPPIDPVYSGGNCDRRKEGKNTIGAIAFVVWDLLSVPCFTVSMPLPVLRLSRHTSRPETTTHKTHKHTHTHMRTMNHPTLLQVVRLNNEGASLLHSG
jgi:hypothetical protein